MHGKLQRNRKVYSILMLVSIYPVIANDVEARIFPILHDDIPALYITGKKKISLQKLHNQAKDNYLQR